MKRVGMFIAAFALVFVLYAPESQAQHYSRRGATGGYFRHYAPPMYGYYGYHGYSGYRGYHRYPGYYRPYYCYPTYSPYYTPYYGSGGAYGSYGWGRGGVSFGIRF